MKQENKIRKKDMSRITSHKLYKLLLKEFGEPKWWPMDKEYHDKNHSDPRFEVIIGAILTQNTAWSNVEKALDNLKSKDMLSIKSISNASIDTLTKLIKPSGFFNQKAKRLKDFTNHIISNYDSNLDYFFNRNLHEIREELLSINGIGPETADSILLYAGDMPIFVVDAYTKRLCKRLPLETKDSYDEIQKFFQKELSKRYNWKELTKIYNELHALIVILAKEYCKKKPLCESCPIKSYCNFG